MKAPLTLIALVALASLLGACGPASGRPAKPPTNDVQPPITNTGDGKVMGADQMSPAQKLEQSPRLDSSSGVVPAETPGEDAR